MKGRMRKITGILLAFVLCIGTASQSGAVTIDEAEKKADQLESDKKKAEEEKKTLSEKLDEIIKKMNETQEHLTASFMDPFLQPGKGMERIRHLWQDSWE